RFDVLPNGFSKKAGESFSLEIIAYDLNGNEAIEDDTSRVSLGSNGSAVFSINPATLSNGRTTVTVRDNKAEKLLLRAQTIGGGAASWSDTITVSPEVPSGTITFASIVPDSITANGTSITAITTQPVRDAYGNVVAQGTLVTVSPSLGTVQSEDKDSGLSGVQRQTESNGAVSVFIKSSASSGVSTITFQSVTGSASGSATVPFMPAPSCAYAGYLTPRYLIPTRLVQFRCSIANGRATGLYLSTQSKISFSDSTSHKYEAHLAAGVFMKGSSTDTLVFEPSTVPSSMLGGTYTPRVKLIGTDIYGSQYETEFDAGSNSVSVSNIEIRRVTTASSIVSRGSTFEITVRVRNSGGSTVSVSDIVPSYRHCYFDVLGPVSPPLPDNLPAGAERDYRRTMAVLANSPLGADTIDAVVTASVGGSQVQDASAYPNVAPIVVQSAAAIEYVASSLSPSTVSKGQSHAFSVSLRNNGEAAVILDGTGTSLTFTDGVHSVIVELGSAGALPGNKATNIVFPAALVPLAMNAGKWPVSVQLGGTENGGSFDETLVLSDSVRVVEPANLAYLPGSITPSPVSKRSAVAFAVGIENTGGALVECIADSTWITFTDGSSVYKAKLDGSRGIGIAPGSNTLHFNSVTVPAAMATGSYQPAVRVKGTENGLSFSTELAPSDLIAVQNPPQLAISSTTVTPSDSVTADQAAAWFASLRIDNNGGAAVRLDSLLVRLYAGSNEVTGECTLTPLNFNPHVDVIDGGGSKSINVQFGDKTANAMTTGTIVIESTVWGRDMNSGAELVATTEFGGKGSYLVQVPASLSVIAIMVSADTVTALQTKDWIIDAVISNGGQSDISIDVDEASTFLAFSTSGDFSVVYPSELSRGGLVLEGGAIDTLRYRVDVTGSVAGLCRIESTVRGTEINSGRALMVASGASGIHADVLVQTEASLEIVRLAALQDPVTIGQ
ncbi:MAG: Ig-like domain-containing protein, partial [Candidatus Krumholzibacteria bacterium]|nr:Ig-like domain-containing protein [Candidatus Krumholzibacteria bacterium]